jgi:hypothetical protein
MTLGVETYPKNDLARVRFKFSDVSITCAWAVQTWILLRTG